MTIEQLEQITELLLKKLNEVTSELEKIKIYSDDLSEKYALDLDNATARMRETVKKQNAEFQLINHLAMKLPVISGERSSIIDICNKSLEGRYSIGAKI